MKMIEKCLVEVEGYPNYRDETRYYVSQNGQFLFGPFKTEIEAAEVLDARIKRESVGADLGWSCHER